ncbi:MAG: extracellular solute-binding protein [Defluviitaleaceae bacterium]|nr:extracellular solute-binding protein [Defluviitaleaceae bacterium]
MNKKFLSFIALAIAIVMVLSACTPSAPPAADTTPADQPAATTTDADTPAQPAETPHADDDADIINLTMLFSENPHFPPHDGWVVPREWRNQWGVEIEFMTVPGVDHASRRSVLLGTGQGPDIVQVPDRHSEFALNGVFLPINEYLHLMPNLSALLNRFPEDAANLYELDGNLYILPWVHMYGVFDTGLAIRIDILEELNLDVPTTMDEFYDVLVAMQEAYPDSTPFTGFIPFINQLAWFGRSWDFTHMWGGFPVNFNYDEGIYESAATHYRFREMLRFMNRLYEADLMDPEIFTQNSDPWTPKLSTGSSFASFAWTDQLPAIIYTGQQEVRPEFYMNIIFPKGSNEADWHFIFRHLLPGYTLSSRLADHPQIDRIMAFMDWWLYSEEGAILTNWGVEGETFEVVDGQRQFTQRLLDSPAGAPRQAQIDYGLFVANLMGIWATDRYGAYAGPVATEQAAQLNQMGRFRPGPPSPMLDLDEMEHMATIAAPIIDTVERAREAFITGAMSLDDDWDAYVADLYNRGMQTIVDMHNSGIGR